MSNFDGHEYVNILAGGQGTRMSFFGDKNKQFCAMKKSITFAEDTAKRFIAAGVKTSHITVVVTNDIQYEYAFEQLVKLGIHDTNILKFSPHYGYSCCMGVATHFISQKDPDALIIHTPSDQYVAGQEEFTKAVELTYDVIRTGEQVMVGVKITDSNIISGCGNMYYDNSQAGPVYDVTGFIEKPGDVKRGGGRGPELVRKIQDDDNTVVNTGLIAWRAKDFLKALPIDEIEKLHDELLAANPNLSVSDTIAIDTDELVRRLNGVKMIMGGFEWKDCGTYAAYYSIQDKDENGVAIIGPGYDFESKKSLIVIEDDRLEAYTSHFAGIALIANIVEGNVYISVSAMKYSQFVGPIAEHFRRITEDLGGEEAQIFQFEAVGNSVYATNLEGKVYGAFLGVKNVKITVTKTAGGKIVIIATCEGEDIYENAFAKLVA